jgi:hypothetical protein
VTVRGMPTERGAAMVVGRVDSAAIYSLAAQAPQRVVVGVGYKMMGGGAAPCKRTASYSGALGALVMGEAAQNESGPGETLHTNGFGAPRPVNVPILVAAQGPTSRNALPSSSTWRPPRSLPPTPNRSRHRHGWGLPPSTLAAVSKVTRTTVPNNVWSRWD